MNIVMLKRTPEFWEGWSSGEITRWLDTYSPRSWSFTPGFGSYVFELEITAAAVLFKLTWGGRS